MADNIEEFKELIKRYETITLKEIIKISKKYLFFIIYQIMYLDN